MEAGKTPRDTLAWVRLGNRAARLDLDDVAADCMNRFLYYRPSAAKITRAVDSLMYASQRYARPMIETAAEREMYAYWQAPTHTTPASPTSGCSPHWANDTDAAPPTWPAGR